MVIVISLSVAKLFIRNTREGFHMPTILLIMGWRFFFYSNERNEPIHIHARKAEKSANIGWTQRILTSPKRFVLI